MKPPVLPPPSLLDEMRALRMKVTRLGEVIALREHIAKQDETIKRLRADRTYLIGRVMERERAAADERKRAAELERVIVTHLGGKGL